MDRSIGSRLTRLARRILWEPTERGAEGAEDIDAGPLEAPVESQDDRPGPEHVGGWRLSAPLGHHDHRGIEPPSVPGASIPRPTEPIEDLQPATAKHGLPVARDLEQAMPPPAAGPSSAEPAADETEPRSEPLPDLPPTASRRRPGVETAPPDLLRVPESAGRVADEFFESLVRHAKGS